MKILGIIPARMGSTRFPGKMLFTINGLPMVVQVARQAAKCKDIATLVVATDHPDIVAACEAHQVPAILTSQQHQSGTDRCAEILQQMPNADAVVNIQGDEPFIQPEQISLICSLLKNRKPIATLIKAINSDADFQNPDKVKVVVAQNQKALYFSRSPIPYFSNQPFGKAWHHVGIYGFQSETLRQISRLAPSLLEQVEALEQLRWLENGLEIFVNETPFESYAIDSPKDVERLRQIGLIKD